MTPATRYLCPLCDWHHDETDPDFSNPDATHPFIAQDWASGIDGLVAGLVAGRAAVVEAAVKAHLETHPLIEWARALAEARHERDATTTCMCTEFLDQVDHPDTAALDAVDADLGDPNCARRPNCDTCDGLPSEADQLTRSELQDLVDSMGIDLYHASDKLDFIREMCDLNDAGGTPITTADVRGWLGYTGCGGVLVLPEEVQAELTRTTADKAATSSDAADIAGEQP